MDSNKTREIRLQVTVDVLDCTTFEELDTLSSALLDAAVQTLGIDECGNPKIGSAAVKVTYLETR